LRKYIASVRYSWRIHIHLRLDPDVSVVGFGDDRVRKVVVSGSTFRVVSNKGASSVANPSRLVWWDSPRRCSGTLNEVLFLDTTTGVLGIVPMTH